MSNRKLREGKYIQVYSIPGGHGMLINSGVIKSGILPDERLFFGFKELDFCLKAKRAGFRNYVVTEPWLEARKKKIIPAMDINGKAVLLVRLNI